MFSDALLAEPQLVLTLIPDFPDLVLPFALDLQNLDLFHVRNVQCCERFILVAGDLHRVHGADDVTGGDTAIFALEFYRLRFVVRTNHHVLCVLVTVRTYD